MKKQNLLYMFALALMMAGCDSHCDTQTQTESIANKANKTNDTIRVYGVYYEPRSYEKCISGVNKQNQTYDFRIILHNTSLIFDEDRDRMISYIERGDTLVLENGRIVKNLTMEHIKDSYIKGR